MRRWPDFKMPGKNAAGRRETTKKEGEFRDIAKKLETGCAAERFLLYSIKSKREGGRAMRGSTLRSTQSFFLFPLIFISQKSEALTLSGGNASFFGQKRREDSFS